MARPPGAAEGVVGRPTLALRRARECPWEQRQEKAHTGATRLHWGQNHVRNTHKHLENWATPPALPPSVYPARRPPGQWCESAPAAHPSALSLKIPDTPGNLIKHLPPGFGLSVESGTHGSSLPQGRRGLGQCVQTHTHISAHELCFPTHRQCAGHHLSSITDWPGATRTGQRQTVAAHFALYTWGWEPKQPADGVGP